MSETILTIEELNELKLEFQTNAEEIKALELKLDLEDYEGFDVNGGGAEEAMTEIGATIEGLVDENEANSKKIFTETVKILEARKDDNYYVIYTNHKVNASTKINNVPFAYVSQDFLKLNSMTIPFLDDLKENTSKENSNKLNISSVSVNTIFGIEAFNTEEEALLGLLDRIQADNISLAEEQLNYVIRKLMSNKKLQVTETQSDFLIELAEQNNLITEEQVVSISNSLKGTKPTSDKTSHNSTTIKK